MSHSQHYVLELQLEEDKKKWYVFAQGISPLFYNLKRIQHFRIYKQWVENQEFQKQDITYRFYRFQQHYRRWKQLKKEYIRAYLRGDLERGLITMSHLVNRLK